jgi:hypothetical protein
MMGSAGLTMLSWIRDRLANSNFGTDQLDHDLFCIAEDQQLPLDYGNDWHLAELLGNQPTKLGNDPKL